MISLIRFNLFLSKLQTIVNEGIDDELFVFQDGVWIYNGNVSDGISEGGTVGKKIDHIVIAATESNLVKKIKDLDGVILALKMPDTDTEMESVDNYWEMNHQLLFLLEKINDGQLKPDSETFHYAKIQYIMKLVKEYMLSCGLNGWSLSESNDETLAKPFHAEWEYNQFGGFNGMSVSFDLKDFSL